MGPAWRFTLARSQAASPRYRSRARQDFHPKTIMASAINYVGSIHSGGIPDKARRYVNGMPQKAWRETLGYYISAYQKTKAVQVRVPKILYTGISSCVALLVATVVSVEIQDGRYNTSHQQSLQGQSVYRHAPPSQGGIAEPGFPCSEHHEQLLRQHYNKCTAPTS